MIQVGASTACFYPRMLEECADILRDLSVPCAEVFVNTESEYEPVFAQQLDDRLLKGGVSCVSVHSYTSTMEGLLLLSEYERRTEDALRRYEKYFAFAQRLGATSMTFHGERAIVTDRNTADMKRKFHNYRRLCDLAAQYGITVAQENVAWCRSEDPDYLRILLEEVPALGFTLDLKQAHRAERHWSEYLEAAGDRLVNVHINDYDAQHSCRLPGEGSMNYAEFFGQLQALGYDRQVIIEVYEKDYTDVEQIRTAMRFLERQIEHAEKNSPFPFSIANQNVTMTTEHAESCVP